MIMFSCFVKWSCPYVVMFRNLLSLYLYMIVPILCLLIVFVHDYLQMFCLVIVYMIMLSCFVFLHDYVLIFCLCTCTWLCSDLLSLIVFLHDHILIFCLRLCLYMTMLWSLVFDSVSTWSCSHTSPLIFLYLIMYWLFVFVLLHDYVSDCLSLIVFLHDYVPIVSSVIVSFMSMYVIMSVIVVCLSPPFDTYKLSVIVYLMSTIYL